MIISIWIGIRPLFLVIWQSKIILWNFQKLKQSAIWTGCWVDNSLYPSARANKAFTVCISANFAILCTLGFHRWEWDWNTWGSNVPFNNVDITGVKVYSNNLHHLLMWPEHVGLCAEWPWIVIESWQALDLHIGLFLSSSKFKKMSIYGRDWSRPHITISLSIMKHVMSLEFAKNLGSSWNVYHDNFLNYV